jgi:hypothetical protein
LGVLGAVAVLRAVVLGGLFGMMLSMQLVAVSYVCMMRGLLVIAAFMMLRGHAMMLRGVFMVLGCLVMVINGRI